MPEKYTVKALHLAKGIEELQKNANIPNSVKPNLLAKSASKVFTEATNSFEDGDEEKAYILFYKYVNMYKLVRKSKEYQKDKSYYDLLSHHLFHIHKYHATLLKLQTASHL